MRRVVISLVVLLVLSGCGGVSLADVQLEPLLVQSGDLPAGVGGAQVRETPPEMFNALTVGEQRIYQQLERSSSPAGGVAVFLYSDAEARTKAYVTLSEGLGETARDAPGIGEEARVSALDFPGIIKSTDLLFRRCAAVVHIRISGDTDTAPITAYAERLDKRLQEAVC